MTIKSFVNLGVLIVGLGLIAYSRLDRRSPVTDLPKTPEQKFERWQLKPGSIYDGDTLRVVKDGQELKIRFCGIDAPREETAVRN